MMTDEQMA